MALIYLKIIRQGDLERGLIVQPEYAQTLIHRGRFGVWDVEDQIWTIRVDRHGGLFVLRGGLGSFCCANGPVPFGYGPLL